MRLRSGHLRRLWPRTARVFRTLPRRLVVVLVKGLALEGQLVDGELGGLFHEVLAGAPVGELRLVDRAFQEWGVLLFHLSTFGLLRHYCKRLKVSLGGGGGVHGVGVNDLVLLLQVEGLLAVFQVAGRLIASGLGVVLLVVGDDVVRVGVVHESVYNAMLPFQLRFLLLLGIETHA